MAIVSVDHLDTLSIDNRTLMQRVKKKRKKSSGKGKPRDTPNLAVGVGKAKIASMYTWEISLEDMRKGQKERLEEEIKKEK